MIFVIVIIFLIILIFLTKSGLYKPILKVMSTIWTKVSVKLVYLQCIVILLYFIVLPLYVRFYLENYSFRFGDAEDNPKPGEDSIISVTIGTDTEENDIIYNINLTDQTLNAIGTRERYNQFKQMIIDTIQLFTQNMPVKIKKIIATPRSSEEIDDVLDYTNQIVNCSRTDKMFQFIDNEDIYDYEELNGCRFPGATGARGVFCSSINLTRTCLYSLYPYEIAGRNPIPVLQGIGVDNIINGSTLIHELGHQVLNYWVFYRTLYDKDNYEYVLKYQDEENINLDMIQLYYGLTYARFNSSNFKDIQDDICSEIELPFDPSIEVDRQINDYSCKWKEFWAELTCFWFNIMGGQNRAEVDRAWYEFGFGNLLSPTGNLTDIETIDDLKNININTIFFNAESLARGVPDPVDPENPENNNVSVKEYSIMAKGPSESSYHPVSISIYDFLYYLYGPPAVEGGTDMCKEIIEKYTPNLRYTCTGKWNESKLSIIGIFNIIYGVCAIFVFLIAIAYFINKRIISISGQT